MQQRNDPGKSVGRPGRAADNSGRRATEFELDEKKKKAFDRAMEKIRRQNADDSSKIASGINQRGQDIYNRLTGNIFMTEADRRQLSNDIIAYNTDLKRLKFYGYDVDGLMDIGSQYDGIMSMRSRIYSQYANEQDYNAAVLSGGVYEDGADARVEIYQKNKNRISELEKILSEGENEAAQEELDALRMMNTAYERGMKTVDDYKVYTQNSDFGWRSKQRDYGNPTAEYAEEYRRRFDQDTIRYDPVAGGLVNQFGEIVNNDLYAKYDAPVVQDKLGAFLNGDVEHSRLQKTNGVASALDEAVAEGDELGWRFLKEDEIGTYYYIYSKDGKEAAEKYLKDMQITLSRRAEQEFQDEISNAGNLRLALYNLASIPMNVVGGAGEGVNYLMQTLAGNTEDFNPYNSFTRQAGIIRGEAANRIEEESGGFNIAGFSYGDAFQSLMSGADSALGAAIGGHAYTVLMGAGAASSEATRLWEMGASQDQIIAGALTAGVAEAAFEYLSIDNFLKMKDPKTISQVIKNILVQGGVEASEEMATELANTVTNGIIMGSQSDWNTEIRRMMETEGISQAEAGAKYISGKLWEAGMGGFISGGAMAGPTSAVNYAANVSNQTAIGQEIRKNGGEDALRQLANNSVGISSETATRKEARMQSSAQKAVQKALEQSSQEPGSNRALGLLSQQVDNLRSVQNRTDVVTALMKDAGMNRWQARKAADTISAIAEYRAEEADIKAYNKLMENDKVSAVLDKLLGDDGAVSFRNLQHRFGRNGVMLTRGDNTASEGKLKNDTKNSMVSKIKAYEDKYDAADNGVTELKSTGEKIKSIRPETNNNGQLTFRVTTEAGETKTVGAEDVIFGSSDQATLYGVFADLGIDADSIAALAEGYSPGTDLTTYILGAQEAYTYGLYNMSAERGSFSQDLTKEQRLNAYQRGQIDAGRKVGRETAEIRKAIEKSKKTAGKKGGVVYEGNRADYQNLSDVQDTSVKVLSRLGEDMGITFHLYKSYVNSSGKRVYSTRNGEFTAPNGFYKDGEIWLDINAGNNGEGMILFTAAHELTHFIKQWSPAKFKVLANFLVKQYGKQGQSVEQLVADQIQKAKDNGRKISYDEAFEEMVADSMETMLTDGTALQKMAELRSTDRGLWEKMKHWWASFAARVKRLYKSLNPDSEEGKLVRQMSEAVEQIRQLFVEGVADAAGNFNSAMAQTFETDGIATDEAGRTVAVQDENGHSVFSLRTYDESGRKLLQKYLDGRVKSGDITAEDRTDMLRQMDDLADICRKYTGEFATFGNWSNAEIVERNGKPVFSVVKKNGEYALNLDFSLVCKKRRTLDAVFNSMIATGLMDNIDTLAEADISRINEIIREYGFETACALCFVDAKRYRQGLVADAFTGLYNQLVRSMAPDGAALSFFNYGGNKAVAATAGIESLPNSALNFDEINRVLATYGKSTVEYKAARLLKDNPSQRKLLLRGDFMSTAGLDAVKTQNPAMLKLYNSKKGTGGPKAAESDVQYLSEIISKKSFNTKKAYAVGGVRIQSFSDYVGRLVFDYIQMVGDLAAKELPAHAYTKKLTFARQFGKTGIKINMSLVPDVADDGVAPGLDKDGNYLWRDGQSFGSDVKVKGSGNDGFRLAVEIQNADGYGKNCGTIAVGISKQHIEKLLSDPDIRMVIPYHKSSLNHLVASMNNVDKFTDYTASQNTKLNGSKLPKGIADFNFNSALQRLGDAKAAADEYLAWCEKNGYTPKFEEFAWHENYYKLLEDFSTYDSDGNAAPQGAVTMTFPVEGDAFGSMSDLIRDGLEEDAILQGNQDDKVPQIVEAIRSEMTARGKVSKNTTDLDQNEQNGNIIDDHGNTVEYKYSQRVRDKKTLDFLNNQKYVTTYKTMQLIDGKLYPPMAAIVAGQTEDHSILGQWEAATEHPELIKTDKSGKPKFTLNKGKGQGSIAAAYNPYMHSSNLVINDQFSGAYARPNLVTVECRVPKSELTSGYHAEYAKDSVGWHSWHTGTVAGAIRSEKGIERQVLLSRWIMPVRIVPDSEVASMYQELLSGTNIAVPDNVVSPSLLSELKKIGIKIKESGKITKNVEKFSDRFSGDLDLIAGFGVSSKDMKITNSERSSLWRQMSDMTSTIEEGEERRIVLYTSDYVWGIVADGYNKGTVCFKRKILDESRDAIIKELERFTHGTDSNSKMDNKISSYDEGRQGNGGIRDVWTAEGRADAGAYEDDGYESSIFDEYDVRATGEGYYELYDKDTGEYIGMHGGSGIMESSRDTAAQTTRSLLTSMDAEALSNATEQKYLVEYQEADRQIREYQKQIGTMTEDLRELRSGKGKRNMSAIRTLQDEITKAENRVNVLSGKLVRLEGNTAIQRVLNRELKQELQAALKEQADSYENQLLLQEVSFDAEMKAQTALLKADKADALDTQKKKYEAALKEQNERLTKKLDELRANKKAALEKQRQKIREQVKIASDNAKQRHGDTLIRHKIQKLAKELNQRLLHPSEKRYVPAEFTKLTVSILDAINLDTGKSARLKEKIANLKVQYEELLKNPTYAMAYDDVFNDLLKNLYAAVGDTPVNKMTTSQLTMVHDVLMALSMNIRYAARVTIGNEEHDAYVLAKEMTDETMEAKGGENLYTKWLQSSLRADVMFERLAGFKKDSAWSKIARMLDDGQLKVTQVIMEGSKIFSELANDKQLKTLSDTKNLVDIGLKDDQGNKLLITRGMMLSVYMHLQNAQNTRHIMSGGLTVPNIKKYYDGKISEAYGIGHEIARGSSMELARLNEELREAENDSDRDRINEEIKQAKASGEAYVNSLTAAIEKQLTEYDRAWIKAAKVFFDDYSKRRLNEATMQMYHFEKAKERNYFPIHTDKNYRSANFESIARDMSLENAGFMKDRITGASSPILLEDITNVINIQLKRTASYVGLAPAIRSFNKIYGKTQSGYENSVQNAVATRFGTDGQKWIENLMADLTGSRSRETTIFDKIRGNMAAATLTLNPRVALAQTASFPTAAAELGWGPVMKALGKGGKNNHPFSRSDQELIEKYSPLLWYRMQGYSNTELGDIRNSQMLVGKVNRKLRFATGWIQAMDGATVGRLWYAAQYYVEDHFKALEIGSDDYYKKVAEVFNRVVEKTQPNYTVMQRPDILRNPNAVYKQLTMFMTQRLQNFNIVYDSAARYTKYKADLKAGRNGVTAEDVKEAKGNVIRAVSSQASAALTITLFKAAADVLLHMMDSYRDEDDELTAASVSLRLLDTFCNSLISSALWGSEIYSFIASKGLTNRYEGITINAIDVLNDVLKGVLNMTDKISKGNVSFKDFYNLSTAITNVFGIPANNAYKIGRGIYQHIVDASNGEFFSFEAGVERTAVQNRELLYQAMVADDRERIEKFSNTFKDDRALHGAIREALRENDHQRIRDAAIARMSGNVEEYIRIVTEIKKEGHFIQDDIVAAVNSEITSIKNEEKKDEKQDASSQPLYSASDYIAAVDADQLSTAVSAKEWLIQKYMSEGKTEKEAERQFYSNVLSEIKDRYDTGIYSYDEAVKMLDGYGGLTLDDAQSRATKWKFNMENPGYEWTEPQVRNYYASAQPVGISIDVFQQFLDGYSECGGENKKDQVMELIDSLPISSEQKDVIYLMYYAESTLHKTPWH